MNHHSTPMLRFTCTYATRCACIAIAACTMPAFAQNVTPAVPTANGYGALTNAPANTRNDARMKQRTSEQQLLGGPGAYGDIGAQGNGDDPQRAALLDERRMTVLGGDQPAPAAPGKRKVARPANGEMRVAAQPGTPNGAGQQAAGTTKNAYADPYAAGKRGVYRSPW